MQSLKGILHQFRVLLLYMPKYKDIRKILRKRIQVIITPDFYKNKITTYLYIGIVIESLNQNTILTASEGNGGVTSQGSSISLPGTPQTTLAGTVTRFQVIINTHISSIL